MADMTNKQAYEWLRAHKESIANILDDMTPTSQGTRELADRVKAWCSWCDGLDVREKIEAAAKYKIEQLVDRD